MIIAQRINDYITSHRPAAFCDQCLADSLSIRRSQANHTTRALGTTGDFARERGECSSCKSMKEVVRRA